MLPGYDMLDVKGEVGIVPLMDATIFAPIKSPFADKLSGVGIHLGARRAGNARAGLETYERHEVHVLDIFVVLACFSGSERSLVRFFSELIQAGLKLRTRFRDLCEMLRQLGSESPCQMLDESLEDISGIIHISSIFGRKPRVKEVAD